MTKSLGMPPTSLSIAPRRWQAPIVESIENQGEDSPHVFISPAEAVAMATPKSLLIVVDTHSQDFVKVLSCWKPARASSSLITTA